MFSKLLKITDIQQYIYSNPNEIADYNNIEFNQLKSQKEDIDEFILLNTEKIQSLDFSKYENRNFVFLLYDFCEQLSLTTAMSVLWHIIKTTNIAVSSRIDAANLFTLNVATSDEYIYRFDDICYKLTYAIEKEEDNDTKAIGTFANYYLVVLGLQAKWINELRTKIKIAQNNYSFLKSHFLQKIFAFEVSNKKECRLKIIEAKSAFLQKKRIEFNFAPNNEISAEQDTPYAKLLKNTPKDILEIRKLSVSLLNDSSEYWSLNRGVAILSREQQLFSYMNSFGQMHFAKCEFAYINLPQFIFSNQIEIYDWGAGQGLATMCYLEFLNKNGYEQKITKATIIEPSQLAIARACLHVQKYHESVKINTINKVIDDLKNSDFEQSKENIKLHIFSNILDIENFSLSSLTSLISSSFSGLNYFICVSPYITESKVFRLQYFSDYFSNKHAFENIFEIEKRSGDWKGYGSWSIVLRIFKVIL